MKVPRLIFEKLLMLKVNLPQQQTLLFCD